MPMPEIPRGYVGVVRHASTLAYLSEGESEKVLLRVYLRSEKENAQELANKLNKRARKYGGKYPDHYSVYDPWSFSSSGGKKIFSVARFLTSRFCTSMPLLT